MWCVHICVASLALRSRGDCQRHRSTVGRVLRHPPMPTSECLAGISHGIWTNLAFWVFFVGLSHVISMMCSLSVVFLPMWMCFFCTCFWFSILIPWFGHHPVLTLLVYSCLFMSLSYPCYFMRHLIRLETLRATERRSFGASAAALRPAGRIEKNCGDGRVDLGWCHFHIWGFHQWGYPKWMVYKGKSH